MKTLPPVIEATIAAIEAVKNPRYFATERGYQGAFYCALRSALEQRRMLTSKRILEMEYQKSARHGLSQRPDIVFHIPTEISGGSVRDNNYAVWALKHNVSRSDALDDFSKLDGMCDILKYPLAIFLNVASSKTRLDLYHGQFTERIHAFAVSDPNGSEIHYSFFENGKIVDVAIGH
jgi:hypothetical protein